jgi:hypothetical protein
MTTVNINSVLVERPAVSGGSSTGYAQNKLIVPNIATLGADSIASVTMGSEGSGYATPPTVSFVGGGGSGAAGTAVLGFAIASVAMNTFGTYTSIPTLSATVGTGATITPIMNVFNVYSVVSGGTGYTVNDILTFTGGTFTSAGQIRVTAVSGGVITAWSIQGDGGSYTALATLPAGVTGGTGTGATFNIFWGVKAATVAAGGQDYDDTSVLTVSSGSATGTLTLASTGGVKAVTVTDGGEDYTIPPSVVFTGGSGSGAAGTAVQASTNDPVPVNLVFSPPLPTASYTVKGVANQAAGISHANKTTTSVDLTLTPLNGGSLIPGLIDVVLEFVSD